MTAHRISLTARDLKPLGLENLAGQYERASDYDALAAKLDEAQNAAVTLSLKLGAAEAALREVRDFEPVVNGNYAVMEAIPALRKIAVVALGATVETDCNHGQIVQNGCPHCERKIGHKLTDDFTNDRGVAK